MFDCPTVVGLLGVTYLVFVCPTVVGLLGVTYLECSIVLLLLVFWD